MVIILIRRFVRNDRKEQFLASYRSEISNNPAFQGETLTELLAGDALPAGLKGLLKPVNGCLNYVNIARWSEWQSFVGHCALSDSNFDPEIEIRPRQRIVLQIVDEVGTPRRWISYRTGVWVWGFILCVWLFFVAAAFIAPGTLWSRSLHWHGALAAAVTAVLGVIWSWFLQLDSRPS